MIYLGIINNVTVSSLLIKEFIVDKLADLLSFKELVERSPGIKSIIDDYNKKSLVLQNIKILDTIQKLFDQIQAIKEEDINKSKDLDESLKKKIIELRHVFLEFFNKDFVMTMKIAGAASLLSNGNKDALRLLKIDEIYAIWPAIKENHLQRNNINESC